MSESVATANAFGSVLAALVREDLDVTDVLARLVIDCAEAIEAEAVAVLARDSNSDLALLSASSHRAEELELLQIQHHTGPCVQAIDANATVSVSGALALSNSWGEVGARIVQAGYGSVEAFPMRWHGLALGGLNVFRRGPIPEHLAGRGQAFADVASLVLAQSSATTHEQVRARLHEALSERDLIEQAKGVLAYTQNLTMEKAYSTLLSQAESPGSLTRTAVDVISAQQSQPNR